MDDETALLERAVKATTAVLRQVSADAYDRPTPCPDWTVRALVNHMVGGSRYFAASAAGEEPSFSLFAGEQPGDTEAATVYEDHGRAAVTAWRTPGATDRRATLPSGGEGPRVFDMHLLECHLHGWDLATALGVDRTLDPGVAQAAYEAWHGTVPPEVRGMIFGPEVPVAPDAPIGDRLAAYLGRTP
jgi:uncharacterized protein (TIGR03086 family)